MKKAGWLKYWLRFHGYRVENFNIGKKWNPVKLKQKKTTVWVKLIYRIRSNSKNRRRSDRYPRQNISQKANERVVCKIEP